MVAGRDRGNALVSIALYVEGGGDSKDLKTMCRRGFRMFVEKAGLKGRMPRISACGGRQNTYESFATALNVGDRIPILLVDSEDPLTAANRWEHLRNRDGWARPNGASNDHCHLMVQVMESWFLADRSALESFYGQGFQVRALPGNPSVEKISKADILHALDRATRNTTKKSYDKGSHSFAILAKISPSAVESVAPSAKCLLNVLRAGGPGHE